MRHPCRIFGAAALIGCLPILGAGAEPARPTPSLDVSPVLKQLEFLQDGRGHYLALIPFGDVFEHLYYGDGKRFFLVRVYGGGSEPPLKYERLLWDPRTVGRGGARVAFAEGKTVVGCESRERVFSPVDAEAGRRLAAGASFHAPMWNRRAYALARDARGTYYYVDKVREPETQKHFRLFIGARGRLRLQRLIDVVSDSAGDVFVTPQGELRLHDGGGAAAWVVGEREQALIPLPLEENARLVYVELGVYEGARLGTPCDDV